MDSASTSFANDSVSSPKEGSKLIMAAKSFIETDTGHTGATHLFSVSHVIVAMPIRNLE